MREQQSNLLKKEGDEQGKSFKLIAKLAQTSLCTTALVVERPFQSEDVRQIKSFLVEAAPYANNTLYPDYWEHILLTSLYAREIAKRIPGASPKEVEAAALIHDIGRLFVPNRYGRTDFVGKVFERKVGIRTEISQMMTPLDRILGMHDTIRRVEDLTLAQRINHVADNLGKRKKSGELFSPGDIMTLSSGSRYRDPAWPSERVALEHLNRSGKEEWANKLVYWEALFFKMEYGIDFDEVRKGVEREFKAPENQRWLYAAQDGQETLDLKVDKELRRPPIKYMVFDIGGVLLQASEQELMAAVGRKLNVAPNKLPPVFQRYYKSDVMAGRVSNTELADILSAAVSKKIDGEDTLEEIFNNPEIYQQVEGMQTTIQELLHNPDLTIVFYSDSIKSVAIAIKKAIQRFYPVIDSGQITISSEISNSKVGGDAYAAILNRLENPDPQSVLFVDDNQEYTTKARVGSNMRGFTFRGNPYDGTTAIQRLQKELQSAGLLS